MKAHDVLFRLPSSIATMALALVLSCSGDPPSAPQSTDAASTPELSVEDNPEPDVEEPDVEEPDVEEPDVEEPDVQEPDVDEPDIDEPDVEEPDVKEPDVEEPDVQEPDVDEPDVEVPAPVDCRPLDELWVTGTPLFLPCEPTFEPCDGVDNDKDGFTDPHCPTAFCASDAECTYGGLVPDADCNHFEYPQPGCNQIDGAPNGTVPLQCQGMLCPPGLKCVNGGCTEPGTALPGDPCDSGFVCPINAGCIPDSPGMVETAVCRFYCHDTPCPGGYTCVVGQQVGTKGVTVEHHTCAPLLACQAAVTGCSEVATQCGADPGCVTAFECFSGCDQNGDAALEACISDCVDGVLPPLILSAISCVKEYCGI